jgi:hypothetical protein
VNVWACESDGTGKPGNRPGSRQAPEFNVKRLSEEGQTAQACGKAGTEQICSAAWTIRRLAAPKAAPRAHDSQSSGLQRRICGSSPAPLSGSAIHSRRRGRHPHLCHPARHPATSTPGTVRRFRERSASGFHSIGNAHSSRSAYCSRRRGPNQVAQNYSTDSASDFRCPDLGAPCPCFWEMGLGHRYLAGGANSSSFTFQVTEAPGFNVTIPVSIPCHSFPKGSPKLNCSSIATKFFPGSVGA